MSRRTTLTLEDDVAERLLEETRRTGRSFKAVVNATLRAGLDRRTTSDRPPFEVRARPMNARPGVDFDDIEGLIERIEGPLHR